MTSPTGGHPVLLLEWPLISSRTSGRPGPLSTAKPLAIRLRYVQWYSSGRFSGRFYYSGDLAETWSEAYVNSGAIAELWRTPIFCSAHHDYLLAYISYGYLSYEETYDGPITDRRRTSVHQRTNSYFFVLPTTTTYLLISLTDTYPMRKLMTDRLLIVSGRQCTNGPTNCSSPSPMTSEFRNRSLGHWLTGAIQTGSGASVHLSINECPSVRD